MLTKIQKWGNSQGIRIPKNILEKSFIKPGEEVSLTVEYGNIIITPTNKVHGKYAIGDLIAEMPADYKVSEEDWGEPEGKEEW